MDMIITSEQDLPNGVLCTVEYDPAISTIDVMNWLIVELESRCKIYNSEYITIKMCSNMLRRYSSTMTYPNSREKDRVAKFLVIRGKE